MPYSQESRAGLEREDRPLPAVTAPPADKLTAGAQTQQVTGPHMSD